MIIRQAQECEFKFVRAFYHSLIDAMEGAEYFPGWIKGIYPEDGYLKSSIEQGQLFIGIIDKRIVSAMVINHCSNEGYRGVSWQIKAREDEVSVIHILCVHPDFSGRGFAKKMLSYAFTLARENAQKALRLDVLEGNIPAEKLYQSMGFKYIDTVLMYYEDTGRTNYKLYEFLI